jgi:sugar lactone lactonase YvrE
MKPEAITGPVAYHGEGPCYSTRWGGLRWLDMLAGDILELAPSGSVSRFHVADVVAMVRPRISGGSVVATEKGIAFTASDSLDAPITSEVLLMSDSGIRMNEGGCDPAGNLWVGTKAYDDTPGAATLYALDSGGVVKSIDGFTICNGIGWSPSGATAYFIDTATSRVDAFDWDASDGLSNRRPFAQVDPEKGYPDGLTVDREGGIWVALWGGGAVYHYSSEGNLEEIFAIPVPLVTSVTFGGRDLDELFITTSRFELAHDDFPLAGSLFAVNPGTRGQSVLEFAG